MKAISNSLNTHSSSPFGSSVPKASRSLRAGITSSAVEVSKRAIAFLTGEGQYEPRIQAKHDRAGNLYYSIFDPVTRETHIVMSENDVRVWLENRYSR